MKALLLRELQEHRGVFTLPLLVALAVLSMILFSTWLGETASEGDAAVSEDAAWLPPILGGIHSVFLLVMFLYAINYLQACLYRDRRDNSILFWKSMPVAEWREVLSKLLVASAILPLVFLLVSVLTQWLGLALVLLVLGGPEGGSAPRPEASALVSLLLHQAGSMVVWVVASLPVYSWFLLVSALAKRSPLMWAVALPFVANVLERMFLGSDMLWTAIWRHLPLFSGGELLQQQLSGFDLPRQAELGMPGLALGVALAVALLAGATWARKYRFEL